MGQVCSHDTEASQYVEVTNTNDHITLQQAFEVQCDEKLMIYYKTFPELNIITFLESFCPKSILSIKLCPF